MTAQGTRWTEREREREETGSITVANHEKITLQGGLEWTNNC